MTAPIDPVAERVYWAQRAKKKARKRLRTCPVLADWCVQPVAAYPSTTPREAWAPLHERMINRWMIPWVWGMVTLGAFAGGLGVFRLLTGAVDPMPPVIWFGVVGSLTAGWVAHGVGRLQENVRRFEAWRDEDAQALERARQADREACAQTLTELLVASGTAAAPRRNRL